MKVKLFALLLVFAIIISGCGGGGSAGTSTPGTGTPGDSSGGSLVIGMDREPDSLDPHKPTAVAAAEWFYKVYDTLVWVDFDLTTIHPLLAESWEVSADGLTYTFKLRQDVKFHSGKPLTAQDVKFTLDRWKAKETASPTANRFASVKDVLAPDEHTVVINMEKRNNELLFNLGSGFASILNEESVKQAGQDFGVTVADGTGPFTFKEWIPRESATFERNPNYMWGPKSYQNTGPAKVDQLVFKVIPESTPRLLELQSGRLDIALVDTNQSITVKGDAKLALQVSEQGSTTYIGFNLRKPIVKDISVRRAVNYAINTQAIVDSVLNGQAKAALGPISPVVKGADPKITEYAYGYNLAKAKEVLEAGGWTVGSDGIRAKDGQKLVLPLYATANDTNSELVGLISSQLREAGIGVEPTMIEEAAIWARLAAGEHTMMMMNMPHSTPDELLGFYFHSNRRPAPNRFDFADSDVDGWLEHGRQAESEAEWFADYHNIQRRVVETAIWAPLYHPYLLRASSNKVAGYQLYTNYSVATGKLLDVTSGK